MRVNPAQDVGGACRSRSGGGPAWDDDDDHVSIKCAHITNKAQSALKCVQQVLLSSFFALFMEA